MEPSVWRAQIHGEVEANVRVFATGATGFIGGHVARVLRERGHEVRALVRRTSHLGDLPDLGVEVVYGDIRDPASVRAGLEGCDAAVHLAADYRLWAPSEEEIYRTNVEGTRHVLNAVRDAKLSRLVYTSTMAVLASSLDAEPHLAALADLAVPYERSKWQAEQEVRRMAADGLPVVIAYPTMPVGSGDRKPTPTGRVIVDFLAGRLPFYVSMDLNVVAVEDVAVGHALALEMGRLGEGYIMGGSNVTLVEFLSALSRVTGRPRPKLRVPVALASLAALVDEGVISRLTGREPRVSRASARMARRRFLFSSGKAIGELGYPQTPMETALERAVAWFRSHAIP